jgi:hypothetical protein
MKAAIIITCIFLTFKFSFAQPPAKSSEKQTGKMYYYPQFSPGIVKFKTGQSSAKLNFNLMLQEMQFIDNKGDTLTIDNEQDVEVVTIGKDSFYYNQGFLKLLSQYGDIKLAVKQKNKIEKNEKKGVYGESYSSAAVVSYDTYHVDKQSSVKLNSAEGSFGNTELSYYIADQGNNFILANKKNILKLFPKNKKQIEDFVAASNIDFSKEEHLKMLLYFVSQL